MLIAAGIPQVDGPVILDGSMGQELIRNGAVEETPLWATEALLKAPDPVLQLHADYIAAGVDVITTNNYSATSSRLTAGHIDVPLGELVTLAGTLAASARDSAHRAVAIAGCLPPLQGSYRPDLAGTYDEMISEYRELVGLLEPHVDLFLCETMSTLDESRAARDAAAESSKPVWVAWTLQNGGPRGLLSGEQWDQVVAAVEADAYLVNCTPPELIDRALPLLFAAAEGTPVGAYANGFTAIRQGWSMFDGDAIPPSRTDLDPDAYSGAVARWVAAGATIVGGCCEIGVAHMQHLCESLRRAPAE